MRTNTNASSAPDNTTLTHTNVHTTVKIYHTTQHNRALLRAHFTHAASYKNLDWPLSSSKTLPPLDSIMRSWVELKPNPDLKAWHSIVTCSATEIRADAKANITQVSAIVFSSI
jgi:hypothetical protein